MSDKERWDSVGWGFFGAMFVLWLAPGIYVIYSITSSTLTTGTRVGTGVVLAFMAAGFTSWAVNSMLDYRARRREAQAQESSGKKTHKKESR